MFRFRNAGRPPSEQPLIPTAHKGPGQVTVELLCETAPLEGLAA